MSTPEVIEKKYNKWIVILSIIIPVVVAALFRVKLSDFGIDVKPLSFLPPIYATINGITAVLLVFAVRAIKNGNRNLHESLVKTAITCSVLFLLMYVAYHMTADSTPYGGEGAMRGIYFFILITHILVSNIIIPFVLITDIRGRARNFVQHRKAAKITLPLSLYVAVSGVIGALIISPYYVYQACKFANSQIHKFGSVL